MTIAFLLVLLAVAIGWFYGKPPTGPTGTTNGAPGSPGCGRPDCELCAVMPDVAWVKRPNGFECRLKWYGQLKQPLGAIALACLLVACGGAVSTDPPPPNDAELVITVTCHAPTGPTSIVTTCAVAPECTATNRVDSSGCFLTHDEVCRYNAGSVSSRIIVPLTWTGTGWYGWSNRGCLYVGAQ